MSSTTAAIQNVVDSLLNIYLLIVALVLALIVLAFAVYMLVYYQHPDDPDQTAGSKIIVIFSIWLVLFIPIFSAIDIASVASGCNAATTLREDWNRFIAGECKAPTQVILYTLMLLAVIWTYLIIPFALNLRVNSLSQ